MQILSPIARGRKGEYQKAFADLQAKGFVRVRVDGQIKELASEIKLDKQKKHNIELVVDRLIIKEGIEKRLADSLELALNMGEGLVFLLLQYQDGKEEEVSYSQNFACPDCGISIEEITPRLFSFNNPFGACPVCGGLGYAMAIDENLLIRDESISIKDGGLTRWSNNSPGWYYRHIEAVAKKHKFSLDIPIKDMPRKALDDIFYGCGDERFPLIYETEEGPVKWYHTWEGLVNNYQRRYKETDSDAIRQELEQYMTTQFARDAAALGSNRQPGGDGWRLEYL